MKRGNSLQFKINLFAFTIVSLIVLIGCFLSILLFDSTTRTEYSSNIRKVAVSFNYLVVNSNEKRLADYLDSLHRNSSSVTEDLLSAKGIELPSNISFLAIHTKGATPILIGTPPANLRLMESNRTWVIADGHASLYVILSRQVPGSPFILTAGTKVSTNEYVHHIKNVFDFDATIFAGNTRVNTTISQDGHDQIGTTLNPEIADIVLGKGLDYSGDADILKVSYLTYYKPLFGLDHEPVGALFVGTPTNALQNILWKIIFAIAGIGLLLLIVSSLITFRWLNQRLLKPLAGLTDTIRNVPNGDFELTLNMDNVSKHYTELQDLYHSLDRMSGEILQSRHKIEALAYYNPITGLANREKLVAKFAVPLPGTEKIHCLYYLDIDHFKLVNDLLGHNVGDLLIAEVGKVLSDFVNVHAGHELYHISGGSFLLCRMTPFEREDLHTFSAQLLNIFRSTVLNREHKLSNTISIGISYCNSTYGTFCSSCKGDCMMNLYELLKNSEIAMYKAKTNGRNGYCIFDADMYHQIKERNELIKSLNKVLELNELEVWYQPQYDLKKGGYRGFEALLRWNRGNGGTVTPNRFIPVAEETGLIVPIGAWVLREACLFVLDLNQRYGLSLMISVNVSAVQLLNEAYVQSVIEILEETGINPKLVELEITESILISSLTIATRKLQELQTFGVSIALDDFGTGYSSLNYLKDLPIDLLKIDKTFIDDVCVNQRNIVGDIIRIGQSMDLEVVAEGVEQEDQLDYLKQQGCDIIQGYYYSKPLPAKDIPKKLGL